MITARTTRTAAVDILRAQSVFSVQAAPLPAA
jgi:hypothetical protein